MELESAWVYLEHMRVMLEKGVPGFLHLEKAETQNNYAEALRTVLSFLETPAVVVDRTALQERGPRS